MDIRLKPSDVVQEDKTVTIKTTEGFVRTAWDSEKESHEAFMKIKEYFRDHRLCSKRLSVTKVLYLLYPE